MKRLICLLLCGLTLLSLTGCGAPKTETLDIFAMDTYMSLVAIGDGASDVLQACSNEINTLEQRLSRTIETSSVAQLNANGSAQLDDDTAALLQAALQYSAETGGTFDVTIAPLVELWGITGDDPRVPAQSEIDALLPLVGSGHVHLEGTAAALDEGCAIDLGGIAKGYASDKTAELFAGSGIFGGFVSLGGNVYVHGVTGEGQPWNVAIQDPRNTEAYACTLRLSDAFVVTSGGYQRFFTGPDGTVYQHIIDPATGYPVQSDLLSVSIVTRRDNGGTGTMADAYSTALYVMGETAAVDFWRQHSAVFDMVLVTADGRLLYTPGLADCFNKTEGSGYDDQCLTA